MHAAVRHVLLKKKRPYLVFIGTQADVNALSTYTFSAFNRENGTNWLGPPDPWRAIYVAFAGWNGSTNRNVASATVGGVALAAATANTSMNRCVSIWSALIPNGVNGDVVMNTGGGTWGAGAGMGIWIGYGYSPTAIAESTDLSPASISLATKQNGMALGVLQDANAILSFTSGLDKEDWGVSPAAGKFYTGASRVRIPGTTITIDNQADPNDTRAVASFGPL